MKSAAIRAILLLSAYLLLVPYTALSVPESQKNLDSLQKARRLMQQAVVKSDKEEIKITIRNVDISRYPEVKIIVEAFNIYGGPLDTLTPERLTVLENNEERKVLSVEKISINERVPVDFVFVIDQTGSMDAYINAVRKKITGFTEFLLKRGIDYNIGLVLYSDRIEKAYEPTDNVRDFLRWLSIVNAFGGGDAKENLLEALEKASTLNFRPSANKVVVIITDAPYHQQGEDGKGKTKHTTESIIKLMNENDMRVFSIVPPRLEQYKDISYNTRGNVYDIDYPFSAILDNFSNQLTNLFALKYRTDLPAIPDSINIALVDQQKKKIILTRKTIPIVELGRKLIIENMLYETASARLPDEVEELEVLTQFMNNKPNVVILVEGHTDAVGSYAVNDRLSLARAESVKNYLINKGISPHRIKTRGYGERKPIASNNTALGRSLNRRTEIVIVSK